MHVSQRYSELASILYSENFEQFCQAMSKYWQIDKFIQITLPKLELQTYNKLLKNKETHTNYKT